MSIWFDLLVREAALLALLAALGSGLVVLLRPEAAGCSRIALAPAFGLALGSGAMVTASYFMPMKIALWAVLLPLAAASLVVAGLIARRAGPLRMPAAINLLQIVLIVLLVAGALSYPLVSQRSLGPLGYQVSDAYGYTALIDGLEEHTLREQSWGPDWDASAKYSAGYAGGFQQIGVDPLAAAAGLLFGWRAVDLQSGLMITLLVVGALGIFATVRGLTRSRSPAATVAALLVAGPLFYQLLIDGSEAAIAGLALIGPIALLGSLVLRDQRIEHVALLGVLAAGLLTLYPLFVPPTVLWAVLVLAVVAARAARAGKISRASLLRAGRSLAIVMLLAAALSPVALGRNGQYWDRVATTNFIEQANQSLLKYDLPAEVIPGWVLQTHEFYYLPRINLAHHRDLLLSAVVPAFLLALMAFGVWRHRASAILLGIVPGAALLAVVAYQTNDCSYCVQRNMLVLGPPAVALVGVGLAALGERRELLLKAAAVATAVAIVVTAGHKSWVTARRGAQGGYALSPDLRSLLPELGGRSGTVLLEAANLDYAAAFEMPSIYNAMHEAIPNRLAIATEKDPYSGLLFLGGKGRRDARYDSNYGWVVTRADGIRTPRRTVARDGPFALQRRRGPLDVAVVNGVVLDLARHDPGGAAWVSGPLTFWVSARTQRRAALRLDFRGRAGQRLVAPADGRTLLRTPTRLVVCVPVQGRDRLRRVRVRVRFRAIPPQQPPERFNQRYVPGHALRLAAMAAGTRPCPAP